MREQIDKRGKQHADGKPRLQDAVEAISCLRALSLRQKPGIARAAAQPQTVYKGKEHRMQRQTEAERRQAGDAHLPADYYGICHGSKRQP